MAVNGRSRQAGLMRLSRMADGTTSGERSEPGTPVRLPKNPPQQSGFLWLVRADRLGDGPVMLGESPRPRILVGHSLRPPSELSIT